MSRKGTIFRDGQVHVLSRKCDTCIFRPGNLMDLHPGRAERMEAESLAADGAIPCHETLPYAFTDASAEAMCRGFYDRNRRTYWMLQVADAMRVLAFDDPPTSTRR